MGLFGDSARTLLVNPIVEFLLERAQDFNPARDWLALRYAFEHALYNKGGQDFTRKHASAPARKLVIDAGCGEGCLGRALADSLRLNGSAYLGFDNAKDRIEEAERKRAPSDVTLLRYVTQGIADSVPLDLAEYDTCLVVSIAVFDHLSVDELCGPAGALHVMKRLLQEQQLRKHAATGQPIPFLVATLDPEFFVDQIKDEENTKHEENCRILVDQRAGHEHAKRIARDAQVSDDDTTSTPFLRSAEWYEREFSRSGFVVLDCLPTPWIRLPPTDVASLRLLPGISDAPQGKARACSSGPFIFWLLIAQRSGLSPPFELREPRAPVLDIALKRTGSQLEAVRYSAGERVIWPGTLGGELSIVEEGSLELGLPLNAIQFGPGQMIGELEAGDNFIASRYLFPLRAHRETGCFLIRIPKTQAEQLLEGDSTKDSLTKIAYELLRDKFSKSDILSHRVGSQSQLKLDLVDRLIRHLDLEKKIADALSVRDDDGKEEKDDYKKRAKRAVSIELTKTQDLRHMDISPYLKADLPATKKTKFDQATAFVKKWSSYKNTANCVRAILYALSLEHDLPRSNPANRVGSNCIVVRRRWLEEKAAPSSSYAPSERKQLTRGFQILRDLGFIDFWPPSEKAARSHNISKQYWNEQGEKLAELQHFLFEDNNTDYIISIKDIRGLFVILSSEKFYGDLTWSEFLQDLGWKNKPLVNAEVDAQLHCAYLRKIIGFVRRCHTSGTINYSYGGSWSKPSA